MTPKGLAKLAAILIKHEGEVLQPYQDSLGYWTVGIGHRINWLGRIRYRKITHQTALKLLHADINQTLKGLNKKASWFRFLNESRQIAIADLAFNVGIKGFLGFEKMIAALKKQDYSTAAKELLKSKYAEQVGQRAKELAQIVRSGEL